MKIMKALFVLLLTSSAIAAQALPVQVVFHGRLRVYQMSREG